MSTTKENSSEKSVPRPPVSENTLLFYNLQYHRSRLAQWGEGRKDFGTYDHEVSAQQMWFMRPHPNKENYYYMENLAYPKFRLYKYGKGQYDMGVTSDNYNDNQLWKLGVRNDGTVILQSGSYDLNNLTKFSASDTDVGTYNGGFWPDQAWIRHPRFEAGIREEVAWEADNRQGSQDFSEKVTITQGLTVTSGGSFTQRLGYKQSMEISLEVGIKSSGVSTSVGQELTAELENSLHYENVEDWSRTSEITFTAPAGKYYRVTQYVSGFSSELSSDNSKLLIKYEIYEGNAPPEGIFEGTEETKKIFKKIEDAARKQ